MVCMQGVALSRSRGLQTAGAASCGPMASLRLSAPPWRGLYRSWPLSKIPPAPPLSPPHDSTWEAPFSAQFDLVLWRCFGRGCGVRPVQSWSMWLSGGTQTPSVAGCDGSGSVGCLSSRAARLERHGLLVGNKSLKQLHEYMNAHCKMVASMVTKREVVLDLDVLIQSLLVGCLDKSLQGACIGQNRWRPGLSSKFISR